MKENGKILNNKSSNLKSKKITKKKSLQEKGITLIALVVTIIILLILVGVTLNMALSNNGLFSKSKEATEKYKQAQSDEDEIIRQIATQMYSEYVGAEVTGYTPTKNKKSYTISTEDSGWDSEQTVSYEELTWKIWDFDGTNLRIISEKPTAEKLKLKGAKGYNNGVYLMNDICKKFYGQYDEDEKMKEGISVSNLKRSDILKVSTYNFTEFNRSIGNDKKIKYGEEKKYDTNDSYNGYPGKYLENDAKWRYENNEDTPAEYDKYGTILEDDAKSGKEWITTTDRI